MTVGLVISGQGSVISDWDAFGFHVSKQAYGYYREALKTSHNKKADRK